MTGFQDICQSYIKYLKEEHNIHCGFFIRPKEERDTRIQDLKICGQKQVLKYLDWLYKDATFYLKRKHDKYLEMKQIMENKR
jgi:hypothetical protein